MKLFLLRVLLQKRPRDEGFTLPMVIALGLVMVLLGTTNIVKSSEENLNAIIQNSSSDAFAAAEVGIARYREFLNQNRILTVYNHEQWTSNDVSGVNVINQTCADMTKPPVGWIDDNDSSTNPPANETAQWWQIPESIDNDGDGDDDPIGEYRLVSYEYDNDGVIGDADDNGIFNVLDDNENDNYGTPESDAVGILTVQGRSPDGSEAQVRVEIPLRINPDDMNNLAPALWIGNESSSTLGTIDIDSDSNIVYSDAGTSGTGCVDPNDDGTNTIISDARNIPTIDAIQNLINQADTAGSLNNTLTDKLGRIGDNPYVTPSSGEASDFVRDEDCRDINDCRYYYRLLGTTIDDVTETDGIAKVTLYVNGSLNINADIGSNVSSSYLEIYVTDNVNINSNNVNEINALIHAPNGVLTVNGGGTVEINGSVWVNSFVNNATVEIEPDTTRTSSRTTVPSYEVYTTAGTRFPRPLTSAPTNWVTEEVQ